MTPAVIRTSAVTAALLQPKFQKCWEGCVNKNRMQGF